jgi:hypothetical protein
MRSHGTRSDAGEELMDAAEEQAQHNQTQQRRYRGVSFEKRNGAWRARLYCRSQHTTLGRFASAELAARSHDLAAVFVMGDRAITNFGVAPAREDLARFLKDQSRTKRCSFRRLVELREAVLRDQGLQAVPDEHHARALRQAAAAIAFGLPPGARELSGDLLRAVALAGGGGDRADDGNTGRGGGGGEGCAGGQTHDMCAAGAWAALLMAAARTPATSSSGTLARK